jgi:hypothetical protein
MIPLTMTWAMSLAAVISFNGLPLTTMISANLPGLIVPTRLSMPSAFAPLDFPGFPRHWLTPKNTPLRT